jgi:pseudouridine kinase
MSETSERAVVCCIGGMSVDRRLELHQAAAPGTSNPVSTRFGRGGVARNVAENLARLSQAVRLVAVVGDDADGRDLVRETARLNVDTGLVETSLEGPTGTYTAAIEPDGELFAGFADMDICDSMDRDFIQARWLQIARSTIVFADTNLPGDSLAWLITGCREHDLPLVIDAVSVSKAGRLPLNLNGVDLLFCNRDEARAMLRTDERMETAAMARSLCQRGAGSAVVTAGSRGLAFATPDDCIELASVATEVVDVTGAGDALVAGTLYGRLSGRSVPDSLRIGLRGAALVIASTGRDCPEWSEAEILRGRG